MAIITRLSAGTPEICPPDLYQQQHPNSNHKGGKQSTTYNHASLISGLGKVTDGDSLRINNLRIRLHAIDAPELSQSCYDEFNKAYPCGKEAKHILTQQIEKHPVTCQPQAKDFYSRIVATCWVIDASHRCKNLSQFMVNSGYAVAYRKFGGSIYMKDQLIAKYEKRGIWRGEFTLPWIWRRQKRGR